MPGGPRPSYDPRDVTALFDGMAATYGLMNVVSSFGFAVWWRRQCVRAVEVPRGGVVLDLMTGQGELCGSLARAVGPTGTVLALDLSAIMCRRADRSRRQPTSPPAGGGVFRADALICPVQDDCLDAVYCSFGLKTLDATQTRQLAREVTRCLRPGGVFSFLEISVPRASVLRWPYMFYLSRCIPLIGRLFLGDPAHYRMLGVYTTAFGDAGSAAAAFRDAGLEVTDQRYFFGCATGFIGRKK